MPPTLDHLSPSQRLALDHEAGPLLIEGPAGTGKTHVLLARLARLARESRDGGSGLLMLAISQLAAAQLRERLEGMGEEGWDELRLLTPSELCEGLLREHAHEAGLDPFFATATRAERVALLLEHLEDLPLGAHDLQGRPAALMASLVQRIDRLKEQLLTPEGLLEQVRRRAPEQPREERARELEFAQLFREHDRLLAERATPDPGELLIRACGLLRDRPGLRAEVAARQRHLFVDDLQEASPALMELIELLLPAGEAPLTVAADPQAALAPPVPGAPDNIRALLERHPGAAVVKLAENLRSDPEIVQAAAALAGTEGAGTAPIPDDTRRAGAGSAPQAEGGRSGAEGGALRTFENGGPRAGARARAGLALENTQPLDLLAAPLPLPEDRAVEFWRPSNERAQAQRVAADIERLIARQGLPPQRIAVLLGSPEDSPQAITGAGQAIVGALEERAIPHALAGSTLLFQRAEVRDILAWMRLLIDPRDSSAVMRVLARPPIELRQVDLVRVVQIARRRKLDMVTALVAAIESPQIPPEARERIQAFLRLHRETAPELDTALPDLFVHRLIERLGLRRQRLFAAHADVVQGLIALGRLGELAGAFARRAPQAGAREFAHYLAAISEAGLAVQDVIPEGPRRAVQVMSLSGAQGREFDQVYLLGLEAPPRLLHLGLTRARTRAVLSQPESTPAGLPRRPPPAVERARRALGEEWIEHEEELFGPAETLHGTLRLAREQLLGEVARVAGRLGELRLDTELDVAHGVVRYLELLKLAALLERPPDQSIAEVLPDINARLLSASTSLQGEILRSSPLDEALLALESERRAIAARPLGADAGEPSLAPFLPRRGDGLVLSASDIETYRGCPLRYKFARVFRIPSEPTLNQRFGIVVHQVLERYHGTGAESLDDMLDLLESGWRRGGLGDGEQERQLLRKARSSLARYHERLREQPARPVWFERSFSFRLGPHLLRGRVDRVDELAEGEGYELIDYKTGLPRSVHQLHHDIQLSLYALAAREAWKLEASRQAYYYVLDDQKVQLPSADRDPAWISETVLEVGEAIMAQEFEPTPSVATCAMCDYRIMCPAAET